MATYLLNSKYSQKLLNSTLQSGQWKKDLNIFWQKFHQVDATHPVFRYHGDHLQRCIPCVIHGDEGVGHRRKPVLHLSWGSLLRTGRGSLQRLFLIASCPHVFYTQYNVGASAGNAVIDNLLKECAASARKSFHDGIPTQHGTFFLVFAWQTKAYRSQRGHLNVSLCPWCLADTTARIPFEDVCKHALWRGTLFQKVPWDRTTSPPLAMIPGAEHPGFIKWDLFHVLPHGCVRNFVASCICMLSGPLGHFLPSDPSLSKDKPSRLKVAYECFADWCSLTGSHPRDMKDFTPENLQWKANRDFPDMTCKGSDTNLLVKWLLDYLSRPWHIDEPLRLALKGLEGYDEFARLSYTGDRLFWDRNTQQKGLRAIDAFLSAYSDLGRLWHGRQWCLFLCTPKVHYASHWSHELDLCLDEGKNFAWSPGAFATPMMEDFIGITSRIARTSHPTSVPLTCLQKYLVAVRKLWGKHPG
eukprot:Skav221521  [mRNA]  locus=scaffold1248:155645:157054:+ [translate_table: standard]